MSRLRAASLAIAAAGVLVAAAASMVSAAGPPFPDPVLDQAVYDTAEALDAETIADAEATIDAIEARTGAEVVVYTQLVPDWTTDDNAEDHAIALMDQWGVGRKGFDDGLVILFDLYESDPCHGRIQLYGGPGYRAKFLTNGERQAIFDNDMLPLLSMCDLDAALLAALHRVDEAATPAHAAELNFFRMLNAVLGLLVAPLAALGLIGWGVMRWMQHGRDPVYLDDPSIHIPAPPPGLTPAAGAAVRDGGATRRALTAASLDLAARGLIDFQAEEGGFLSSQPKIGIRTSEARPADAVERARLERTRRRPMDPATSFLHGRLQGIAGSGDYIKPDEMLELGKHVTTFDEQLEAHVVAQGWFREPPAHATRRWVARGFGVIVLGVVAGFAGFSLPSDGLVVVAVGLGLAGVVLLILARSMPARTMPGAMIRAMLEAYRRTLDKTMAQARSMAEVVSASAIPLIESPDDAVVWGVALGLQDQVEEVLGRTAEDLRAGAAAGGYLPAWYHASGDGGGGSGGGGGWAPGLMSASPIPNFGGMMAALGGIGNSPSSSGSGGGGGFGGGGSGGGGGGAGGGF